MSPSKNVSGVYFLGEGGSRALVHEYLDGDYELADVVELFALGEATVGDPGGAPGLVLQRADLNKLKVSAHAESFDHDEGFIEMCLDIWRFGELVMGETLHFVSLE
jgi:hypothetical protein